MDIKYYIKVSKLIKSRCISAFLMFFIAYFISKTDHVMGNIMYLFGIIYVLENTFLITKESPVLTLNELGVTIHNKSTILWSEIKTAGIDKKHVYLVIKDIKSFNKKQTLFANLNRILKYLIQKQFGVKIPKNHIYLPSYIDIEPEYLQVKILEWSGIGESNPSD